MLNYQRYEIANGEWWRLVTGNFLHTNHWHLLMNLAGMWIITLLHAQFYTAKWLALLFFLLAVLEGLGLYLLFPNLIGYVGLSGILHGFFTFGALKEIQTKMKAGYLLLGGVIAKVAYEQYFGATEEVSNIINARVATESHLIGVIAGIIVFVGYYIATTLNNKSRITQ
ncbi:rhombosortase [Shewanella waksmanii]|uniref:rhombosortase n=1 Tax=Shewanella waksmanii TaxID=213783 RepID=UPI003735E9F0